MTLKATLIVPLVLTLACGSAAQKSPETPEAEKAEKPDEVEKAETEETEADEESGETAARISEPRKLGDYFVYRYSGDFTQEPLTLVEQVVAEEFGLLVVDMVLERGQEMNALRVRMKRTGQVVSVAKIGPEGEAPASLADYEAFVGQTRFSVDANDENLGSDDTTCLVGAEEVDCTTTTYAVRVGDREGVLSVTKSGAVPGRDVGGEVLAADGSVLYRAQLLERGNEEPATDAVAWAGRTLRFVPEQP